MLAWMLVIMAIVIPDKWQANSPLDPEQYRWECPYSHIPPRDYKANIEFRIKVNRLCDGDKAYRAEIWKMCARDPLFYLNTFGWIYEPRSRRHFAWVTYPFQDDEYPVLIGCIGNVDVGWDKCRGTAASWGACAAFGWFTQFHEDGAYTLVSRNEDQVDSLENPDCLFWKLDYLYARQPEWLRPEIERKHLHLRVPATGSVTTGCPTTGDVTRGGRRTCIAFDEFPSFNDRIPGTDKKVQSASQAVSDSRLYIGTPKGAANEMYKLMHEPNKHIVRIRTHWLRHPVMSKGAYRTDGDRVEILDPADPPPAGYKFRLPSPERVGGDYRSPRYDIECERAGATNESIEQEMDIGYHGSDYPFFRLHMIERLVREHCVPPRQVGKLEFDFYEIKPLRFRDDSTGDLRLWAEMDPDGRPMGDREYVAAADISQGTGASNSCLHIVDKKTRRIVAELASAHLPPHDFADYCVAICRWFHDCLLAWESNGPGRAFEKRVMSKTCRYRNVWYRPVDEKERGNVQKASRIPGWPSGEEAKELLLQEYRAGLDMGAIINPSKRSIEECRDYKTDPTGKVAHVAEASGDDPTGAKKNHGDRVIAAALAYKLLPEFVRLKEEKPDKVPPNSWAAWRAERTQAARRASDPALAW